MKIPIAIGRLDANAKKENMNNSKLVYKKRLIYKRFADYEQIRKAIWLYFFLLIFEGALRKWVLPGLSDILLIVRDPVAIYILFKAFKYNLFQRNPYVVGMTVVSVISFFTAFFGGHGNLIVATYGLRIMLLHFPLIFVIGKVFARADIIRLGKFILWLALPMVILISVQFYSPQSVWVNRGLAGSLEGAGFSGANGFFRPPGTFSFTLGNSLFWGLVTAYLLYFWLHSIRIKKLLLISVTASLVGAMSFSISRTLFFEIILTVAFALVATNRKPTYFWRMIIAITGVALVMLILSQFTVFNVGLDAFSARFDQAGDSEGGLKGTLGDRFLGGMITAVSGSDNLPFWGQGLGMGTNAGARILTGNTTFLISEGEWGRIVGETGLLLGLSAILIRVFLSFNLFRRAYYKVLLGDALPWMLLSFGFLNLLQGQWAQPTSLGFSVITGGLIMAALKRTRKVAPKSPEGDLKSPSATPREPSLRIRSGNTLRLRSGYNRK